MRSSSFRVPLFWMSIAGNTRLSTSLRSRWISMLPVPLNSSKITSSMRDPVSTSAVATIVSDPPSPMLPPAANTGYGAGAAADARRPLQCAAGHAAREHLAGRGHDRVVGARQAGDRVEQNHDV